MNYHIITVLFLSSIIVIIYNIRSLLHFINPSRFEKLKANPNMSAGMGYSDEELYNDEFQGERKQIKF